MLHFILLTIIFITQSLLLCSGIGVTVSYVGAVILFALLHGIGELLRYIMAKPEENRLYLSKSTILLLWYGSLFLLGLLLYRVMFEGGAILYQAVLLGLEDYYGISLGAASIEGAGRIAPILLLVFLSALLLPVYQCGERPKASWWFFVIMTLFVVSLPLLLGVAPKLVLLLLLLAALLLYRLLFFHPQLNKLSLYGQMTLSTSLLVLMGVALLFSGLLEPKIREKHDPYTVFQKNLEGRLGLGGWSDYNSGYLTNNKPVHTHQIMLSLVTKRVPEDKLYLRGYVGADYSGSSWEEADSGSYYKEQKKKGESKLDTSILCANTIYEEAIKEGYIGEELMISYNRVRTPYVYTPYFSYLENDKSMFEENGDATLLRNTNMPLTIYYLDPVLVYEYGIGSMLEDSSYEAYVNTHYKEVPRKLKKKLLDFLGGEDSKKLSLSQKVKLVTDKLDKQCVYQQELSNLSIGEDYVEHFLWEEKAGYCTHFATAATLLFRCLDVPARYASGYQVRPEDFRLKGLDEVIAEVPDDMAHAWTEVYFPHLGWIPVETTPGYENSLEGTLLMNMEEQKWKTQNTEDEGLSNQATTQNVSQTVPTTQSAPVADEKEMSKQEKKKGHIGSRIATVIIWIVIALLLVCLCLGAVFYGRREYRRYLYRLRHQKNAKQALYAVTRQLMKELRRWGYQREEKENELLFLQRVLPEVIFFSTGKAGIQAYKEKEGGSSEGHLVKKSVSDDKEELDRLIVSYYESLRRAAYSMESITEDDVAGANQLYDSLFK